MNRELNLAPQTLGRSKGSSKSRNTIILVAIATCMAVAGSFGFVIGREILLNKKVEDLRAEVNESKLKVEQKNTLEKQISLTQQQITKANTLKEIKANDTDELLKEFRALVLVDGVTINSMDYTGKGIENENNSVTVKCTSPSKDAIQKVWANLRENDKFVKSYINSWQANDGNYGFDIKVTLGGSKDEAK